jgi:N-acetylglucosamine malate deacetylase 2
VSPADHPVPGSHPPAGVPAYRHLLAVCAHPDDETFGLGALIDAFVAAGATVDLVCLTHGEASTLSAGDDLGARREAELACAAETLGIRRVVLAEHPDGRLADVPIGALLADLVVDPATDAFLVYDHGGVTGHPDHQRATDVALAAAATHGLPVLAWALPVEVATQLDAEFGTGFVGRALDGRTSRVPVDRTRQLAAMACHGSQLADNPLPRRRLELQGPVEHLRELTPGAP